METEDSSTRTFSSQSHYGSSQYLQSDRISKGKFSTFSNIKEALSPTPGIEIHNFRSCDKGPHCSKRQIISTIVLIVTPSEQFVPSARLQVNIGQTASLKKSHSKKGSFPQLAFLQSIQWKDSRTLKNVLVGTTEQCKFDKQNLLTYNFEAELISCCKSDVKLLKEGFMEYRRLIQSVCSGIDPFELACTAAFRLQFYLRQLFMPKDSIAILPQNGYTGVELTSFPAALWLCWIEQTARDRIGEKWADEIEIRLYNPGAVWKKEEEENKRWAHSKWTDFYSIKHAMKTLLFPAHRWKYRQNLPL